MGEWSQHRSSRLDTTMPHTAAAPAPARFTVQLQRSPDLPAEPGEIAITDVAIAFRAAAGPVPWAGRSVRRKVRAWLAGVSWETVSHTATLDFGSEKWVVTGRDAEALARALDARSVASRPTLVSGEARVTIGDEAPLDGRIVLDADRLRFRVDGARFDRLHAAWSSIGNVRLTGIRPCLHATVGGRSVRIDGPHASQLAAWLTALAEQARVGADTTTTPRLERWEAQRRHGALAIQGEMLVSNRHVQFVPSGLVERTLGLKDVVLPFDGLHRIVVHGWTQKKLTFVTDKARETFTFDDVDATFDALVHSFHDGHREWLSDADRTRTEIEAVLALWAPVLDSRPIHVMEAHLAVQLRERHDATVGVLVQTADEVRFLPSGGPAGTAKAEAHPVPRILRNYSGSGARGAEVCFSVSGEHFRYLPAEGAEFVRRFWDRCRAPSRIFHLDAPSRRALMRVLGPSRFVRMRGLDGQLIEVAALEEEGRTWSAVIDGDRPLPGIGQRISMDVGQPEGVYRFESEVVDLDAAHRTVHFARPGTVRVYNQRRSYRVAVDLSATVRVGPDRTNHGPIVVDDSLFGVDTPEAPTPTLRLSDLSLGGCAASGATDIPLGASVELEVDIDGHQPLRVTGRVLRADKEDGSALRRFGIRFENVRRSEEVRLQRHVLRAQREELADLDAMVG